MKTQLSLQELATEITRRADKKEDMIGDTRAIGYEPDRTALVIDGREFAVNDHAHDQGEGARAAVHPPYLHVRRGRLQSDSDDEPACGSLKTPVRKSPEPLTNPRKYSLRPSPGESVLADRKVQQPAKIAV